MKAQFHWDRLIGMVSWMALLLAGILAVVPLVPPAVPAEADAAEFSVARAMAHIERIAQEPRPQGSPGNQRARAEIVAQLEKLGLEAEVQIGEAPGYYAGAPERVEIGNVVARIPGTAPGMAVALAGHYDTVPGTPGANDDASAVAIMLEAARAILAGPPLRHDVLLVFIDAEEPAPRYGSSAFVAEHPWAGEIGFVINLEALGSGGPSLMVGMNGPGGWIVDQYRAAVASAAAYSFLTTTTDLIGGSNSDFATFRDQGITGVEFAYLRGSPIYHTPADTVERVSRRSLQQQGANTLALARQMGNLVPGSMPEGAEATFFTVGRFGVVRYASAWVLPLALVAGAVLAVAVWRQGGWLRMLGSAARTVIVMLVVGALAAAVWTVLAGWRSMPGIAESTLYLAGFLVLAGGIEAVVGRGLRRRFGAEADASGVVAVWWALGLVTGLVAPGISYLFTWPALAGGVVLLGRSFGSARRWQPVLSVLVLGTVLVLLAPAVDAFYVFAQPRPGNPGSQMLWTVTLPVMLLLLGAALFRVFWLRPAAAE